MILILPREKKEKKIGSIIVPATIRDKMADQYGTVIAVGADTDDYDMPIKEGDEVLFMDKPNHIEVDVRKLVHIEDILLIL